MADFGQFQKAKAFHLRRHGSLAGPEVGNVKFKIKMILVPHK